MNNRTKTFIGAGLAALLLLVLAAGSALAQGPAPWRSGDHRFPGMMGRGTWNTSQTPPWGPGAEMPCQTNGAAVPSGNNTPATCGNTSPGAWSPGMMGGRGVMDPADCPMRGDTSSTGETLTLDQAQDAAGQYLTRYGNDDLEIAEAMQFSDNFYVEVREASTGIGAMELLVDPYTGIVHPEPGPNMMWNTKYGHMGGRGMMGWYRQAGGEMTVTADEAIAAAQDWLDANLAGVAAGEEAEPFYGYYTIHTLSNGEISGMLSVNGYTGQVWYHNWHGDFIDMTAEHSD